MEQSHPETSVASAEPAWEDRYTMFPGEDASPAPLRSPQWVRTDSSSSSHSALTSEASFSQPRLSPISAATDIPGVATDLDNCETASAGQFSASTLENTPSSSSRLIQACPVSPSYIADVKAAYDNKQIDLKSTTDCPPDGLSDIEQQAVLKMEFVEEDTLWLDSLQEVPFNTDAADVRALAPTKEKRSRGRPRKQSRLSVTSMGGKTGKGRSRTGCITCKRRKKKCDELRPRCKDYKERKMRQKKKNRDKVSRSTWDFKVYGLLYRAAADGLGFGYTGMNCEKNGVVCEGYIEKHIWKSNKEKAKEELLKSRSAPAITMQPIFIGLETTEDRVFWKHYNDHLSSVFTVEGEHRNAFRDMLVPLATRHQGMMHSLLSLADSHLDHETPYGQQIRRRVAKVTVSSLKQRGHFHRNMAVKDLYESMERYTQEDDSGSPDELAARYGQILCLILESLAHGDSSESQVSHYGVFLYLIQRWPPVDPAFLAFIFEIFYYHIFADDLVCYPSGNTKRLVAEITKDWTPTLPDHQPRLLGVADGLLHLLSQVTAIRNHIRTRISGSADPPVDYESLYRASNIESDILGWSPMWPAGDSRVRATLLYKQMTWLYLKTTICPPFPGHLRARTAWLLESPSISSMASAACSFSMSSSASLQSPRLEAMPPRNKLASNSRRHSIANPNVTSDSCPFPVQAEAAPRLRELPSSTANLRTSPPPSRLPESHHPRISVAIEESLVLLESFNSGDPAQTLLLVPCVVVGAVCYSPAERDRVRKAIRVVHGYTGLRNTHNALCVLDEVWRLMDLGDYLGAWDWQAVAARLGVNHLF